MRAPKERLELALSIAGIGLLLGLWWLGAFN
jgi:hypothetical protein